jgi:hypothetical protein
MASFWPYITTKDWETAHSGADARQAQLPEIKRNSETCVVQLMAQQRQESNCQQDSRIAHGRGRARHVPDQAVACGGERSLMGTPTSRLTRTVVVKAVPEKYS